MVLVCGYTNTGLTTPSHTKSVKHGYHHIVEFLLVHGARHDIPDDNNVTAYELACRLEHPSFHSDIWELFEFKF